jgi:hypothetical protein
MYNMEIDTENSANIIMVVQEIMDAGQLWISIDGDEYYIPELIAQIKELQEESK